ncbi:hypothetical protein Scep_023719 [Stephania cephalantha]|uniref:Uncharacterized protein n=1 Tax=Stephania cephalantha TaxID=152367 RepID=A0AAP0HXN8_9MAGN
MPACTSSTTNGRLPRVRKPETTSQQLQIVLDALVGVCGNYGEYFHPTYACPHYPKYRNHHGSSYASPQPNFYMSRRSPQILQQERITIADIERDMIFNWLFQSTTQQPLQEDMQHINPKLQNSETQVTTILEHLMDEKEFSLQPVSYSKETVNAATLKNVEFDEFSIVGEYLSELEETLEVYLHDPDITIALE